jgi:hypothetical protein
MQNESSEIDQNLMIARKREKRYPKKDTRRKSQPYLQKVRHKKVVVVPAPNDIFCGRGRSYIYHEGNQRFRDVIFQNIGAYLKSSHRPKRSEVVKAVVHEMLRSGARFLKQLDNKLEWYDGGVKVAKEKVGNFNVIPSKIYVCILYQKPHSLSSLCLLLTIGWPCLERCSK